MQCLRDTLDHAALLLSKPLRARGSQLVFHKICFIDSIANGLLAERFLFGKDHWRVRKANQIKKHKAECHGQRAEEYIAVCVWSKKSKLLSFSRNIWILSYFKKKKSWHRLFREKSKTKLVGPWDMMQFASKYLLEIRTCSEENTVLPVHETYFLVSLWEPNELQNICKVQSVNYAFMYVEEMSHDGGSHWTWSIVGFYPLLSLKASLKSG